MPDFGLNLPLHWNVLLEHGRTAMHSLPPVGSLLLSLFLSGLMRCAHGQTGVKSRTDDDPRTAIEQYFQAHALGKSEFIEQAFAPDGKIKFVDNGELKEWTRDEFAKRFQQPAADAVPWLIPADVAGLPAFTARRPEIQIIAVKPNTRMRLLVFIKLYLLPLRHVICFSPYRGSPELCLLRIKSRLEEVAGEIVIGRSLLCHFGVIILSSDTA
jgi:hypothetical protein